MSTTILLILCGIIFDDGTVERFNYMANYGLGNHANSFFVMIYSLFLFCVFLCLESKIDALNGTLVGKTVEIVGSVSFEIYLVGDIFLALTEPYFGKSNVSIFLRAIVTWCVSLVAALIINQIKWIGCKTIKLVEICNGKDDKKG